MPTPVQRSTRDGIPVLRLESDYLCVEIAPEVGGRIVSLVDKSSGHELLWRNPSLRLERLPPFTEYDPHFFGGIDELLPNDIPEEIGGVQCPDHGELWTTALEAKGRAEGVHLAGRLPRIGLYYEREVSLAEGAPEVVLRYRLKNVSGEPRSFLWKLHAALAIQPGDVIECPARKAQVVDPAWSRFGTLAPFDWPVIEGTRANIIPAPCGKTDFFYLYDLQEGRMAWRSPTRKLRFAYHFDMNVFPYCWLFASYGGFNGHYTAVLEPCTAMPISVKDAAAKGQCSRLDPEQTIATTVKITVEKD